MDTSKGGRPPSDSPKTRPRQIRFTEAQDQYVQDEADKAQVSFAEYVRSKVVPGHLK